jgi:hypothetical protein
MLGYLPVCNVPRNLCVLLIWLTPDSWLTLLENGVEITDGSGKFKTFYETLQQYQTLPRGEKDLVDVIITGKVRLMVPNLFIVM